MLLSIDTASVDTTMVVVGAVGTDVLVSFNSIVVDDVAIDRCC
jgi:hypothetical protein